MLIRDRQDLEKMVREAIQVDTQNWKATDHVLNVRKLLNDETALNPINIRNYRSRGIPETVLLGAAIAYSATTLDGEIREELSNEAELLIKAREIYERITGLAIGMVEYTCELKKSKKYKDCMDAEVTTCFRHPIVHHDFGSSILPIQVYSDVRSLDDIEYEIESYGPGMPDAKDLNAKLDMNQRQRTNDKGVSYKESKGELVCSVRISSSANSSSYIKLKRRLKGAFRMRPNKSSPSMVDREYAAFRVNNPVRALSLTLSFPEELFISPEHIPIQTNVWGPGTLKMDEVDYLKTSALLAPNAPLPRGNGKWQWKSNFPLMMGMVYALTYNVQDVWNQVREKIDAGEKT